MTGICMNSPATIRTRLLFAHIRASTGTPVQRSNCHPFRFDRWLFMHNGAITDFHTVKSDLMLSIDPSLYPDIEGSTDSETLFFLALTFGLMDDPPKAIERAVGLVEEVGHRHGIEHPIQMTVATSDWCIHLGVPLFQCRPISVPVLFDGRGGAPPAPSGGTGPTDVE